MTTGLALRIDWSELDLFGHVNNVAFFKYIQASRVHYWEKLGLMSLYQTNKTGCMLASTSCVFRRPLFYPGNIIVKATVEFVKNSSFGMHHTILNEANEIVAEAHDIVVLYDFGKNEKVAIPEMLKKKMLDGTA